MNCGELIKGWGIVSVEEGYTDTVRLRLCESGNGGKTNETLGVGAGWSDNTNVNGSIIFTLYSLSILIGLKQRESK